MLKTMRRKQSWLGDQHVGKRKGIATVNIVSRQASVGSW